MNARETAVNTAKRVHQILITLSDDFFIEKAGIYLRQSTSSFCGINIWRDDPIMNSKYGMLTQIPDWESTIEGLRFYFNPSPGEKFEKLTYAESFGKYNTITIDDFKTMNTDEYYFQNSLLYKENILNVMYVLSYLRSTDIDFAFSLELRNLKFYEDRIDEVLQGDF